MVFDVITKGFVEGFGLDEGEARELGTLIGMYSTGSDNYNMVEDACKDIGGELFCMGPMGAIISMKDRYWSVDVIREDGRIEVKMVKGGKVV